MGTLQNRCLLIVTLLAATTPMLPGMPILQGEAASQEKHAPDFSLTGSDGKKFRLSDVHNRRVVLFFFCGCQACAEMARAYGELRRTDPVFKGGPAQKEGGQAAPRAMPPLTVIVFSGEKAAAVEMTKTNRIVSSDTVVLPDPELRVSLGVFKVESCPVTLVLDAAHVVRYSNRPAEGVPEGATPLPVASVLSRVVSALRAGK